jgi:ATP-binding cassette subfamily B (MDR/TAP) protein 1
MISSIPPIAISFAIITKLRIRLSTHMQAKYGDAGNVVEQTLGAIRTVSATRHMFVVIHLTYH